MSSSIEEMVAYTAVRRVQSSYADIVTRQAWPELGTIMTADCRITINTLADDFDFVGPVAIGAFIDSQIRERFSFFEFVVLNTVMEVDPDSGLAAARMYMHEVRQERSDGSRSDAYGVYHDRFVRDDAGQWWFARRFYQSFARTNPDSGPDLLVFDPPEMDLKRLLTDPEG